MSLINWHWLEDLLVRLFDREIRSFAADHPNEQYFAACLELDEQAYLVTLSLGSAEDLEDARERDLPLLRKHGARAAQLLPDAWACRRLPILDPEGIADRVRDIIQGYSVAVGPDEESDVREFLRGRAQAMLGSVIESLRQVGSFEALGREPDFIVFHTLRGEALEWIEDRLQAAYPDYTRGTMEWSVYAGMDGRLKRKCDGCREEARRKSLRRCTACQRWQCPSCRAKHTHPELLTMTPLRSGGGEV